MISKHDKSAQKNGFENKKDFRDKRRFVILCLIQLNIDFEGVYQENTSLYKAVCSLYQQYKNTELRCACCGENQKEFLTLDHVHNNGAEHKKSLCNSSNVSMSQYLLRNGFKSSDYQILCYNCNSSLGFNGYCPHHPETKRIVTVGKRRK